MFYQHWIRFFIEAKKKGFDKSAIDLFLKDCIDLLSERWMHEEEREILEALREVFNEESEIPSSN